MKKSKTPTFLLELPLAVDAGQAKRLRAHFEAARCLYNALLDEELRRLKRTRADPAWQAVSYLEKQQEISCNETTTRTTGTQACLSS